MILSRSIVAGISSASGGWHTVQEPRQELTPLVLYNSAKAEATIIVRKRSTGEVAYCAHAQN